MSTSSAARNVANQVDHPLLAEAIELLRESFYAFSSRRRYGKVGIVIDLEAGVPVTVRDQTEAMIRKSRG